MSPDTARAVVEARLGRPAQDRLEAAVVLEAWCGLQAEDAIERGRKGIRREGRPASRDHRCDEGGPSRSTGAAEGIPLVLAVLAVATWASPLSEQLGASVWDSAIRLALPLTLALQWLLWSRHLSRGDRLGSARLESPFSILALVAIEAALFAIGAGGAVAGLLLLIWVGGTFLVSRGWVMWYALGLVSVAAALQNGVDPYAVLGGAAFLTLLAVFAALATSPPAAVTPGRWSRAVVAGLIGGGLGALLVTDYTIGWGFRGALPALALIPSAVGGFWGGRHLSRVYAELPRALRGVPVSHADRITWRGPGLVILAGSIVRLIAATLVLSVVCAIVSPLMLGTVTASLFVGFGCLALATLLVSLLVSLGRLAWALFGVTVSVCVEVALELSHALTQPGGGLIVGTTVAALLMLPPIVKLLVRPGRALATAVWIP